MALEEGSTNAVIKRNIARLVADGFSKKQAVAIAMRRAGRAKQRAAKRQEPEAQ